MKDPHVGGLGAAGVAMWVLLRVAAVPASASRRMWRLYSVVKVRRFALGDTSVGAVVVGEAVVEAGDLDIVVVRGALLCKLGVRWCLTHLDTQGRPTSYSVTARS